MGNARSVQQNVVNGTPEELPESNENLVEENKDDMSTNSSISVEENVDNGTPEELPESNENLVEENKDDMSTNSSVSIEESVETKSSEDLADSIGDFYGDSEVPNPNYVSTEDSWTTESEELPTSDENLDGEPLNNMPRTNTSAEENGGTEGLPTSDKNVDDDSKPIDFLRINLLDVMSSNKHMNWLTSEEVRRRVSIEQAKCEAEMTVSLRTAARFINNLPGETENEDTIWRSEEHNIRLKECNTPMMNYLDEASSPTSKYIKWLSEENVKIQCVEKHKKALAEMSEGLREISRTISREPSLKKTKRSPVIKKKKKSVSPPYLYSYYFGLFILFLFCLIFVSMLLVTHKYGKDLFSLVQRIFSLTLTIIRSIRKKFL